MGGLSRQTTAERLTEFAARSERPDLFLPHAHLVYLPGLVRLDAVLRARPQGLSSFTRRNRVNLPDELAGDIRQLQVRSGARTT
jgi:hypothetical protein